jgi:two-component system sensor histidine kinase/response regulator
MKSRILVVDDNPKNIQVLATHLRNDDYEVEYASNGKEAVQMVTQENFDLILLDVMMPGIDGFETCRRIKKIENKSNIPIIFVTAKTDMDSLTLGFEYGGVDYISKPFKADELLLRVSTHVELKKSRDLLNYHKIYLEKNVEHSSETVLAQRKEFSAKNKDLENTISMQSDFIQLLYEVFSKPLSSLQTPISLLKLENLNENSKSIVSSMAEELKKTASISDFCNKNESYFSNRQKSLKNEKVNLSKTISYAIDSNASLIKKKKLAIKTENILNIEIIADKSAMEQIFSSVLLNAIQHSSENDELIIKMAEDNNLINVSFSDLGTGFEKNIINYPFKPIKKTNKDLLEFGLSLFFAKFVFDLQDFKIKIGNNKEKGAFVLMTFFK